MKSINTKRVTTNKEKDNDELSLYYETNELKKSCELTLKELRPVILGNIERGCIKSNSGQYEAKKIIKERKKFNEDIALKIINNFMNEKKKNEEIKIYMELKKLGLIKTKEYIDMDALERAVEKELIDSSILIPAQEIQYITELRVNKIKGD